MYLVSIRVRMTSVIHSGNTTVTYPNMMGREVIYSMLLYEKSDAYNVFESVYMVTERNHIAAMDIVSFDQVI